MKKIVIVSLGFLCTVAAYKTHSYNKPRLADQKDETFATCDGNVCRLLTATRDRKDSAEGEIDVVKNIIDEIITVFQNMAKKLIAINQEPAQTDIETIFDTYFGPGYYTSLSPNQKEEFELTLRTYIKNLMGSQELRKVKAGDIEKKVDKSELETQLRKLIEANINKTVDEMEEIFLKMHILEAINKFVNMRNEPADADIEDTLLSIDSFAPKYKLWSPEEKTELMYHLKQYFKFKKDLKEVAQKVDDQPTETDIEAFINGQNFAKEYEKLSPSQKAALQEEPSWLTVWFEETLGSFFEAFPSVEDSTIALVEKYPFLLEWYSNYCEYMYPDPEPLDIPYEADNDESLVDELQAEPHNANEQ